MCLDFYYISSLNVFVGRGFGRLRLFPLRSKFKQQMLSGISAEMFLFCFCFFFLYGFLSFDLLAKLFTDCRAAWWTQIAVCAPF